MNVILRENVPNLGSIGDLKKVSSGFFRNYLFPKGLAVHADENNIAQVEHQKRALKKKLAALRADQEAFKAKLEGISVVFRKKAGENQKLFGSITNQDIAEYIESKGISIDRHKIELDAPIKKLGSFKVAVKLMDGIAAEMNISVVADVE